MSGWIAVVIVVILAIPFAFFGMEQYLFQSNANYAAKVSSPPSWWKSAPGWWPVSMLWQDVEVSPDDFRTAFEQERQRQREQQGDRFDARGFETIENKRVVLERLVDQAVMRLAATRSGIAVGDAQVRETIQSIPAFQVDGRFDPQRYQMALAAQGQSPVQFQEMVREGLQQGVIPAQVAESAFTTRTETERMLRLLNEVRDVSFVVLPAPEADSAEVGAQDIEAWYAANTGKYRAAETVALEYVEIDATSLPEPLPPDEASLRQRYEQEKARFVEPEQRLASHILIAVSADADEAAQKAAEDKARQLAEQAGQPGADFAALAREHSDDPGSKATGGDLGWVARDMMVKPFEDALFGMQAGDIQGPVQTQFGWHVLQLREVQAGHQVTFENVRAELAREQAQVDRERAFNDAVGRFVDEVYKNPTSLEAAAASANLTVRTVGPFARGEGSGIAAIPAVARAAFSESLVQDGTVSDPIEIGNDRSVLIRVAAHAPERAMSVDEARGRIVADIRADRIAKQAEADSEALLERLRKGETLDALAAERGLSAQSVPGIPRGTPIPDGRAAEAYFQTKAPVGDAPSAGKVLRDDGSVVVFTVDKVTPGDSAEASDAERGIFARQLAIVSGEEDAQALLRALRKGMKVTVIEERL